MKLTKAFTKLQLLQANEAAVRDRKEKSIDRRLIDALPPDARVRVDFALISDAGDMRCQVQLGGRPSWVDVSMAAFKSLADVPA